MPSSRETIFQRYFLSLFTAICHGCQFGHLHAPNRNISAESYRPLTSGCAFRQLNSALLLPIRLYVWGVAASTWSSGAVSSNDHAVPHHAQLTSHRRGWSARNAWLNETLQRWPHTTTGEGRVVFCGLHSDFKWNQPNGTALLSISSDRSLMKLRTCFIVQL